MRLQVGNRIRVKPYNQVVDMYKRGKFDNIGHYHPTNNYYIYGIDWNEYYYMSGFIHKILDVDDLDFLVHFNNNIEDRLFCIPPILIQNINLPDELFEL